MARAHRKLGSKVDDGEEHFTKAIQIGESLCGPSPSANAACLDLATSLAQFGRYLAAYNSPERAALQ